MRPAVTSVFGGSANSHGNDQKRGRPGATGLSPNVILIAMRAHQLGSALAEGDGWVNWSELATIVPDIQLNLLNKIVLLCTYPIGSIPGGVRLASSRAQWIRSRRGTQSWR